MARRIKNASSKSTRTHGFDLFRYVGVRATCNENINGIARSYHKTISRKASTILRKLYSNTGTWLDEKSVVTGSSDHSVRIWNINDSPHEVPPRVKKKEESTKDVET